MLRLRSSRMRLNFGVRRRRPQLPGRLAAVATSTVLRAERISNHRFCERPHFPCTLLGSGRRGIQLRSRFHSTTPAQTRTGCPLAARLGHWCSGRGGARLPAHAAVQNSLHRRGNCGCKHGSCGRSDLARRNHSEAEPLAEHPSRNWRIPTQHATCCSRSIIARPHPLCRA
jgi:hypothetical protein